MIKPMLAVPMHKGVVADWTEWAIEEKYDGHRVIIQVGPGVTAWTRPRRRADGTKDQAQRALPAHLNLALAKLPDGVYDGELLGGATSTDVTRLDLQAGLRVVLFDVLRLTHPTTGNVESTLPLAYDERRRLLAVAVQRAGFERSALTKPTVSIADSDALSSQKDVQRFVKHVWDRGGEGAIIKRRASTYQVGKRSPDWIKVKKCQHATLTVVGFEPSRGTVRFPGHPFAIVVLEDDKGNRTTVKTKDDHELRCFEKQWAEATNCGKVDPNTQHPAIGRRLVIEYQDRTRDGGYRHPMWDRWEDE